MKQERRDTYKVWVCLAGCRGKSKKCSVINDEHCFSAAHLKNVWDEGIFTAWMRDCGAEPGVVDLAVKWHRMWGSGPYLQGPYFPISIADGSPWVVAHHVCRHDPCVHHRR